jgi:uncharacterized membrane protein YozB (DUF420 family)
MATVTSTIHADDSRGFYVGMAIATVIVVVAGFSPTYYFRPAFDNPPLPSLVSWHALIMSLWPVFFLAQTVLIKAGQTRTHRRLGMAGAMLAVVIFVLGFATMIYGGRHGFVGRGYPGSALSFMSMGFFDVSVFALLIGTALYFRRDRSTHKRLMLLATVALWPPAVSRLPIVPDGMPGGLIAAIAISVVVVAWAAYEFVSRGRPHPALVWAGVFFIASLPLRFVIGMTEAWVAFAGWMLATFP